MMMDDHYLYLTDGDWFDVIDNDDSADTGTDDSTDDSTDKQQGNKMGNDNSYVMIMIDDLLDVGDIDKDAPDISDLFTGTPN